MKKIHIIVTGTDPNSSKGGIGLVLPGYFSVLHLAGYEYECISTYKPGTLYGKWIPWLQSFPTLLRVIRKIRAEGKQPIVYSHAGNGLSFFRESMVLWWAKLAGAKTILQSHSANVDGYLNNPLQKNLLIAAFAPASLICVLTQWWKDRLVSKGIKTAIYVMPNPLPENLLDIALCPANQKPIGGIESVKILSMARLVAGKGVDIMIRAMEKLPDNVNLIVAGDGDQRKLLEKLSDDLGVSNRIIFTGWVSGEDKTRLLEEADIFCLPSTYDVFPMSMVEAMAYGIPVVAVRWGGIPDMVADGRVGFLANQAQPEEIAVALVRLLDKEKRHAMGVEAKKWVLEISSPEHVAEKLKEVVEALVK